MLRFELPNLEHETLFQAYKKEFEQHQETWIHGDGGCSRNDNYQDWLIKDKKMREGKDLAKNLVPGTTYFVLEDDKIVGTVNIRHYLNEYMLMAGGHVGYSVIPSKRRQGIATKILQFALQQCHQRGIHQVLVICHKDNIASKKTIEHCGGMLENEVVIDNETYLRYWIEGEER